MTFLATTLKVRRIIPNPPLRLFKLTLPSPVITRGKHGGLRIIRPTLKTLFRDRDMRGLAQHFTFGNFQSRCDRVETDYLRLTQHGLTVGAVAIHPFHHVNLLPRSFNQIAQKEVFVFQEIHDQRARGNR